MPREERMPRVVRFEIPAEEPERAVKFYESVFGWKISTWGGPMAYWLVSTGPKDEPGIDGAIIEKKNVKSVVNTIGVASLDESIRKALEAGGKQLMEKDQIPGVGWFCYCQDPDGNMFGLLEPLPGSMPSGS
jgi:predicted enzyme related to lactoylglutathione lyase